MKALADFFAVEESTFVPPGTIIILSNPPRPDAPQDEIDQWHRTIGLIKNINDQEIQS